MDQWKMTNKNSVPTNSTSDPRHRTEVEVKNAITARKVQKADREKLRRDKLNEQFLELGIVLDPDRPKNDKATILTDTIQTLKDLTAEVNRLKTESAELYTESRELTQEKNELREEKATLKSDIDNLNVQHQQRLRNMFPWAPVDPSVVMAPPYSFPVAVPVPPVSIPMHPPLHSFHYFGNPNPGAAIPNPCSTFIPYPTHINPHLDQPSTVYASTSHLSGKLDSRRKCSDHHRGSNDVDNDVLTELELKTPGSTAKQESSSPGNRKGKQPQKEKNTTDGSCSSRYSSSQGFQDSSSNSIGDITRSNN